MIGEQQLAFSWIAVSQRPVFETNQTAYNFHGLPSVHSNLKGLQPGVLLESIQPKPYQKVVSVRLWRGFHCIYVVNLLPSWDTTYSELFPIATVPVSVGPKPVSQFGFAQSAHHFICGYCGFFGFPPHNFSSFPCKNRNWVARNLSIEKIGWEVWVSPLWMMVLESFKQ